MRKQQMTVAAVQMNCDLEDWEANTKKAERLIEEAVKQGAEFIVLPELFNTGYRVEENDSTLAESIPGKTSHWMTDIAQEHSITLVACYMEKSEDKVYDVAVAADETGVIGGYRKTYLWDREKERFSFGHSDLEPFNIDGDVQVGLQICYEVGFPEPSRLLTLNGADIIVYPSAFGKARSHVWDIATRARAIENGIFVIAANRTGTEKSETVFGGKSRIVSPSGDVLQEATREDEVIVATINLADVDKQRRRIPYLEDLDTSLYNETRLVAKERREN